MTHSVTTTLPVELTDHCGPSIVAVVSGGTDSHSAYCFSNGFKTTVSN